MLNHINLSHILCIILCNVLLSFSNFQVIGAGSSGGVEVLISEENSASVDSAQTDTNQVKKEIKMLYSHLRGIIDSQQLIIRKYQRANLFLIILSGILIVFIVFYVIGKREHHSFPFIRQKKGMHPGLVCLQMLMKHYGISNKYKRLQKLVPNEQNVKHLSIEDLASVAENRNLITKVLKIDFKNFIEKIPTPHIAHLGNHMAVVYHVDNDFIYLSDPFYGKVKMNYYYYAKAWLTDHRNEKGIVIFIYPGDVKRKKISTEKLSEFSSWNRKYWKDQVVEIQ